MRTTKIVLVVAALTLASASAVLGTRSARSSAGRLFVTAPAELTAFELADQLTRASPDTVVIALDDARHPLRGALPASVLGADDAAVIAQAPRARRLTLVGRDVVRVDRVARRLVAIGRDVTVLAGGVDAWDRAMDADPSPPGPGASADVWQRHRTEVALRHAFGDPQATPAAPVAAPVVARPAAAGATAKKREGC